MQDWSHLDLGVRLPWLTRWKGSQRIVGLPCFLPGCRRTVGRSSRGRPKLYCTDKHRLEAHTRRVALVEAIEAIEAVLRQPQHLTRGLNRDQARSDLKYLDVCLAAYRSPRASEAARGAD